MNEDVLDVVLVALSKFEDFYQTRQGQILCSMARTLVGILSYIPESPQIKELIIFNLVLLRHLTTIAALRSPLRSRSAFLAMRGATSPATIRVKVLILVRAASLPSSLSLSIQSSLGLFQIFDGVNGVIFEKYYGFIINLREGYRLYFLK